MKTRRAPQSPSTVHVKRRSRGSYNEISLSVLDERKDRLPDESEASRDAASFGEGGFFKLMGGGRNVHKKRRNRWIRRFFANEVEGRAEADDGSPAEDGRGEEKVEEVEPTRSLPDGGRELLLASGALEGDARRRGGVPGRVAVPVPGRRAVARNARKEPAGRDVGDKKRSRPRAKQLRLVARVALVAAAVVLTAAAALSLYRSYVGNLDGAAELESALESLSGTDDLIDDLDAAVVDPFAEGADELRESVEEGLEAAFSLLEEADLLASEAIEVLVAPEDQEVATRILDSAAARQELLELGKELMALGAAAQSAIEHLEAAWNCMVTAAELASDAAQLVSDGSTEDIEESLAKTQEALAELACAREELEEAESAFDVDLSAYYAYIDKREEALGYAVASDEALLDLDADEAVAQNDAYNEADAESSLLAAELPDDPRSYVEAAYEKAAEELEASYNDAWSRMADADAAISSILEE